MTIDRKNLLVIPLIFLAGLAVPILLAVNDRFDLGDLEIKDDLLLTSDDAEVVWFNRDSPFVSYAADSNTVSVRASEALTESYRGRWPTTRGLANEVLTTTGDVDAQWFWATPAGGGNMTKAVYDVANDGFVDGKDTAYGVSWNANIDAPSMNSVYDRFEALLDQAVKTTSSPTFVKTILSGNEINIATAQTPASPSAAGTQGDIAWDSGYIYVAVAGNTWKRAALSTWAAPDNVIYNAENVIYAGEQVVY